MPQTKEIDPYRNPTKEVSLGEILRMHGVPSAEQEALQPPSIMNELVGKYVDEQLQKRGYSPAFVKAADAGVKAMIIAAPVAGLANRMIQPESYSLLSGAGAGASGGPPSGGGSGGGLTEILRGGSGPTTPLETGSTVPYHADYMGSTQRLRWNDLPDRLGYERRMPWEGERNEARGHWAEYERLRAQNDTDLAEAMRRGGARGPEDFPPGLPSQNDPNRPTLEQLSDPNYIPPSLRPRGQYDPSSRHWMSERDQYSRPDYSWRVGRSLREQRPAPVRSLGPYEQPTNRFYGRTPTQHLGRYGSTGTRELKGGFEKTGAPTGMIDTPRPISFGSQGGGAKYAREAARGIPSNRRRPGLVVHDSDDGRTVYYAYFNEAGKPLAGATARRYSGGLHVSGFGADMDTGLMGKKAAVEVGMAMLRSGPISGGSMSQFSRGLFGRIAEAASNPKLRAAYRRTSKFPADVKFEDY